MSLVKSLSLIIYVSVIMTALCIVPVSSKGQEIGLEEALATFYQNNYDVIVSKYEIDKAYADYLTAKLLPNPNLTVSYTNLEMSRWKTNRWDNTQLTIRLDQLLETAGKRGLRTSAALETLEATRIAHKDVIRNLLIGFYTLYFNLNLTALNVQFAENELLRYDRVLQIADKRFTAGFLSSIDHAKLKLGRIDLENNHTNLWAQLNNDTESFSLLLGSDARRQPAKIQIHESLPVYNEQDLVVVAKENRFDLLSLQRQLKAAEYNLSLAKAYRVPDISIGGEYDSTGSPATPGVGFGISLPIPLFNRHQGEIAKRGTEQKQIEIQIAKVKRIITSEVRQALNTYAASLKVFEAYRNSKSQMDLLIQNSEKAFTLGGITVLELLDSQKTYRDFITKYNQALVQSTLNKELIKVYTGEIK